MSRYSLANGVLIDMDKGLVYSPSRCAWVKASMSVASALDGVAVSDERAAALVKAGTTRDPVGVLKDVEE